MSEAGKFEYNHFKFRQRLGFGFFQFVDHFFGREKVQKVLRKQRHRLFLDIACTLRKKGSGKTFYVERCENLSIKEFKKEYLNKNRPVILAGAAKEWACSQQWDLEYLRSNYGSDQLLIVNTEDPSSPHRQLSLSEALDNLKKGGNENYIRFYNLLEKHPERVLDFDYTWLRRMRHKWDISEAWQVFIGVKEHFTNIHNAPANNFFVMAHGEKTWIMQPMYFAAIVDPIATKSGVYRTGPWRNGKPFNPFKPDYKGHPLYRYIDNYIVELKEGDVLFNPAYWWHTVKNETETIGIGYRWINPFHNLRFHPLYFLLDLTARKPGFFKSIKMWNSTVNKVFLAENKKLSQQTKRQV